MPLASASRPACRRTGPRTTRSTSAVRWQASATGLTCPDSVIMLEGSMPDVDKKAEALRKLGHDIRVMDVDLLSAFGRGQVIQRLRRDGKLVWAAGSDPRCDENWLRASHSVQGRRCGGAPVLSTRWALGTRAHRHATRSCRPSRRVSLRIPVLVQIAQPRRLAGGDSTGRRDSASRPACSLGLSAVATRF